MISNVGLGCEFRHWMADSATASICTFRIVDNTNGVTFDYKFDAEFNNTAGTPDQRLYFGTIACQPEILDSAPGVVSFYQCLPNVDFDILAPSFVVPRAWWRNGVATLSR